MLRGADLSTVGRHRGEVVGEREPGGRREISTSPTTRLSRTIERRSNRATSPTSATTATTAARARRMPRFTSAVQAAIRATQSAISARPSRRGELRSPATTRASAAAAASSPAAAAARRPTEGRGSSDRTGGDASIPMGTTQLLEDVERCGHSPTSGGHGRHPAGMNELVYEAGPPRTPVARPRPHRALPAEDGVRRGARAGGPARHGSPSRNDPHSPRSPRSSLPEGPMPSEREAREMLQIPEAEIPTTIRVRSGRRPRTCLTGG